MKISKRMFVTILMFIVFMNYTKAEVLYNLDNPTEICNSVTNDKFKIYVYNYYDNASYEVSSDEYDDCNNSSYSTDNLSNITKVSELNKSWTWYGLNYSKDYTYYIEGKKDTTNKGFFEISNYAFNKNDIQRKLRPGDKIYFEIDVSDEKISSNYNDLRISFEYVMDSTDNDINLRNSVSYYAIDNNGNEYGPYKLYDTKHQGEIVRFVDGKKEISFSKDRIISENINKEIPSDIKIDKIRVVPYENYNIHSGYFRLLNLSIEGYNTSYSTDYNTVYVNNASDITRHNIVNNMVRSATIKWDVSSSNNYNLNFYHLYNSAPQKYSSTSGMTYYGIPYTNRTETTIESFVSNTTKDKNSNANFSYVFPSVYQNTVTSTLGTTYNEGNEIDKEELYVYEYTSGDPTSSNKVCKNTDLTKRQSYLCKNDYIQQVASDLNIGYLYGMDCGSSTFSSVSQEIPYISPLGASKMYYSSGEVEMLGDMSITIQEVESYLRNNNIISSSKEMSQTLYTSYYSDIIREKYDKQKIFNGYGLLKPGDIVDKMGHARIATGYTHVVCEDGTSTDNYINNFCETHGGINGNDSYAITTEISSSWKNSYTDYIAESENSWKITLDSKYTDLESIDDYVNKISEANTKGIFYINKKYTFETLYYGKQVLDEEEADAMYMPFRFKKFDIINQNKVLLPAIDIKYKSTESQIEKDKYLRGTIIGNYLINGIKYEINGETYYDYPKQNNVYSIYNNIPDNIKEIISNIDYDKGYNIKVSVKEGPVDLTAVSNAVGTDSDGYIELLNLEKVVMNSIKVTTKPTKTKYFQNIEDLDLTGGILTVGYSNGDKSTIALTNKNVEVTGFDNTKVGKNKITVSYNNLETSFDVEIIENNIIDIDITAKPTKTKYFQNIENLDLTGGILTATYASGKKDTISLTNEKVKITGFDNTSLGKKTITVRYEELETSFDVEIIENSITGIEVTTKPTKTKYFQNIENLDLTGGILTATYASGKKDTIPLTNEKVVVTDFDNTSVGTNTLTVSYNNLETSFDIEIIKDNVKVIEITTKPTKTKYYQSIENLDLTGGILTVTNTSGKTDTIPLTNEEVEVTGFDNTNIGTNTITVGYNGLETSFDVEIIKDNVKTIKITTSPTKTKYFQNIESLDLTGGILTTTYESGKTDTIPLTNEEVEVTGFDNSNIGKNKLTVRYEELETSFDVEIIENSITGIEVTTSPTKTTYYQNLENLDLTGGILTVIYANGKKDTIPLTNEEVEVTGFDNTSVGTNTLTVNYNNLKTTFDVKIIKDIVKKIKISTKPTKKIYYQYIENLDLTGGILTATYESGKTDTIPLTNEEVEITGFDNTSVGNNTITVSYNDLETSFDVEIIENSITGIEVTTSPTKTTYFQNIENLDLTGGIITVNYSNGDKNAIPLTNKDVVVTGFDNTNVGTKTITVNYNNLETSFDVNIIENNIIGIDITTKPTKAMYYQNIENLDLTGGILTITYASGKTDTISLTNEEVEVTGFDNTSVGKKTITVRYEELKTSFDVEIIENSITGIEITKSPTKTKYYQNIENLDLTGGILKVTYASGKTDTIPLTNEEIEVTGFNNTSVGTNTLTVNYYDLETSFDVEIINDTVKRINVSIKPIKTIYYQNGESLDLSGGILTVTYTSGKIDTISLTNEEIEVTGFDNTSIGTKTITVNYHGLETSFEVAVIENIITNVEVTTIPTKVKYIKNSENLDLTGGILTVSYLNGDKSTIPLTNDDLSVKGFDNTSIGIKTITISYKNIKSTFDIEVINIDNNFDDNIKINPKTGLLKMILVLALLVISVISIYNLNHVKQDIY